MKILVTGSAGFIGYHLSRRLAEDGHEVLGLDNVNDYYDVTIKHGRLAQVGIDAKYGTENTPIGSSRYDNLRFVKADLCDGSYITQLFQRERFDAVCHLAAQAGVRYSLSHPHAYVKSNIEGFLNILEAARSAPPGHLVYASSSSVYGIDKLMPFGETGAADHPASLYAASKRADELMAHSYSHLYGIPTTGLRFFTVYGPWGRPDMALFLFTAAMLAGRPIEVFNHGEMERDFTYIGDIVEGVVRVMNTPPAGDSAWDGRQSAVSPAPYRVYNIGNGAPVRLLDFIEALEKELGIEASKEMLPLQPGDVPATWADCSALERDVGYKPDTPIREGIHHFVKWYREFYGV